MRRLFVGECGSIFGGQNFVGEVLQGIVGDGCVLLGTENDADGWVLAFVGPVFLSVVEVKMRLAGVGVGEFTERRMGQKGTQLLWEVGQKRHWHGWSADLNPRATLMSLNLQPSAGNFNSTR